MTPGTVVEENLLDGGRNNYLAALFPGPAAQRSSAAPCGLAHVDVSTGEFACLEGSAAEVAAELERLRPGGAFAAAGGALAARPFGDADAARRRPRRT